MSGDLKILGAEGDAADKISQCDAQRAKGDGAGGVETSGCELDAEDRWRALGNCEEAFHILMENWIGPR